MLFRLWARSLRPGAGGAAAAGVGAAAAAGVGAAAAACRSRETAVKLFGVKGFWCKRCLA